MSGDLRAATRQRSGSPLEYRAYVYDGNRVVRTCEGHTHRRYLAAIKCSLRMLEREKKATRVLP